MRCGRSKFLEDCEKWAKKIVPEKAKCTETDATPVFTVLRFLVLLRYGRF